MARNDASAAAEREKSKRVGALSRLWPFLNPYRTLVGGAALALVLTACVSLILPMAVRRVVDNFGTADAALLNERHPAQLGQAL
ncbi:MAG: ABC transporter, partial [Lutimaribacter sp.]